MPSIPIPVRATLDGSYELTQAVTAARNEPGAVEIDCTDTKFFDPFGTALIGALLALRRNDGRRTSLVPPRDPDAKKFLSEVSLDQFITGDPPRHATLEIRQLRALDPNYTSAVTDMLTRGVPGINEDNSYPIQLCLNELLQNVFEWSESPMGSVVLARWYHKSRSVKLCVVDLGIGIPAALRRAKVRELQRESDAAVLEAAVATPLLTSRANQRGGLGLKTILDVVGMRGGKLTVLSLGAKLTWLRGRVTGRRLRPPIFRGTAVALEFRPDAPIQDASDYVPVF